jgi:hypothetical protein
MSKSSHHFKLLEVGAYNVEEVEIVGLNPQTGSVQQVFVHEGRLMVKTGNVERINLTIPAGQSEPAALQIRAPFLRVVAVHITDAMTPADLSFEVDGGAVYSQNGQELVIPQAAVVAGNIILLDRPLYAASTFSVRSGTKAAPVPQAAQRNVTLLAIEG